LARITFIRATSPLVAEKRVSLDTNYQAPVAFLYS